MRRLRYWAVALSMAALAWGAVPAKKASAKKGPAKKSAATAKKAPAKGSTATRTAAAGRTSKNSKNAKKAPTTTWRNRQLSPTSDRFREIQDALAAKGYLKPENATGAWDQASIEGLKRFQADQNIDTTGKINSLSLIALGLGPKRDLPTAVSPELVPNR